MSQNRRTPFVGVSLTPMGRDALQRLAAAIYAEQILTSKRGIVQLETLRGNDQ
jgi:hypothetical protein